MLHVIDAIVGNGAGEGVSKSGVVGALPKFGVDMTGWVKSMSVCYRFYFIYSWTAWIEDDERASHRDSNRH